MNYQITVLLLTFMGLAANICAAGISSTTNGVYLVVGAARHALAITNEPIQFDDRLVWMAYCDTGKIELSCPLDVAYGVKIKMTDTNGMDVAKTAMGKQFGSKFENLHKITDSKVYPELAWGSFKENLGMGGARFLPTPKELFQIKTPGIYTLEIQMQMFRYVASHDPDERSKTLFRFSPIKIKVEKPEE